MSYKGSQLMAARRIRAWFLFSLLIVTLVVFFFISRCNEPPPPTITPTPTFPVSATPTGTPTPTPAIPTVTATATPTISSPTPLPSHTPTPTGTPSPTPAPQITIVPTVTPWADYVTIKPGDTYWWNAWEKYDGRYVCWQWLKVVNGWHERALPIGELMERPNECSTD